MPVSQVQTEHVLKALRPIWTAKPVTARKVRERLERVFDAAKVRNLRDGENPARWRGHLDALLARGKPAATHHAAMAYDDLPAFMVELAARDSMSARALRWTILTAARTGETIGAPWSEIEVDLWVIPKERMKMDRPHRVPLTEAAKACLPERGDAGDCIFVGRSKVGGLSNMAMAELLKGMRPGLTVHGFRSTFRDWAGDRTAFQREVIEAALAHQVGDEVERAYRRSDALEKRRGLMADGSILNGGGVLAYRHLAPNPRLCDLAEDDSLEGSCNCGWEGPVAVDLWSGAEMSLPLSAAALHLRCTGCGGRNVIVTMRRGPPSPRPSAFRRWR